MPSRRLTGFVLALLSLVAGPVWSADPADGFFDTSLGDFHAELAQARTTGKTGILLFFEMDDCPFCHRMKETVFNRPEVRTYYRQHFLIFPVDIEGEVSITDFAGRPVLERDFALRQHRVRATPVFAFYDLDGRLVARYTGPTTGAEEFLWLGEYVVGGHYREMPFTRYKRQREASAPR